MARRLKKSFVEKHNGKSIQEVYPELFGVKYLGKKTLKIEGGKFLRITKDHICPYCGWFKSENGCSPQCSCNETNHSV